MCFRVGGNSQQGVPGGEIDDMVQIIIFCINYKLSNCQNVGIV